MTKPAVAAAVIAAAVIAAGAAAPAAAAPAAPAAAAFGGPAAENDVVFYDWWLKQCNWSRRNC